MASPAVNSDPLGARLRFDRFELDEAEARLTCAGEPVTVQRLEHENVRYCGTAGVSAENRSLGFQPAFADRETRAIYLSRFADGRPAPCHVLDGLPCDLVLSRRACGRVAAVKASLVSGFVRDGRFYTREEAAAQAAPVAGPAR